MRMHLKARLKKAFLWRSLLIAMRRPAPDRVPRSGPRAEGVDCYSVDIRTLDGIHCDVLVRGVSKEYLTGTAWNGDRYADPVDLPFWILGDFEFSAKHYIGIYEASFSSVWKFVLQESIRWPYVEVAWEKLKQKIFDMRTPRRMQRIAVLKKLIEIRLDVRENNAFVQQQGYIQEFDLLREMYGIRIFGHPEFDALHRQNHMILESLVSTGDVIADAPNRRYAAHGSALQTIARYEEDNRRYRSQIFLNRVVAVLIFFTALAAIVQVIESKTVVEIAKALFR